MPDSTIQWQVRLYSAFSLHELEAWLALRQQVFVVEQNCPYPDIDGRDAQALHLCGYDEDRLVAGARLFAPEGISGSRIGRVVVAPDARGIGLGRILMQQAMLECEARWPGQAILVSAQAHLQSFYASLGFDAISGIYDETGSRIST